VLEGCKEKRMLSDEGRGSHPPQVRTRQKFDTHVGFSGDAHTAAALAQSFGPFAIGANFPGFAHCSPELPSDM
jgi:hypothetical protein